MGSRWQGCLPITRQHSAHTFSSELSIGQPPPPRSHPPCLDSVYCLAELVRNTQIKSHLQTHHPPTQLHRALLPHPANMLDGCSPRGMTFTESSIAIPHSVVEVTTLPDLTKIIPGQHAPIDAILCPNGQCLACISLAICPVSLQYAQ